MLRRKKAIATILLCVALGCLCACAPSGEGENGASGATVNASDALEGSMRAVHTDEAWGTIEADPSKKMCLSCHPRDTISAQTEDYAGAEGYNPHAPHTESYDCVKCHSMTGMSVLVCNTACHGGYHGDGEGWPLPEGNWQSPTDDLPSADGEGIPNNI